MGVMTCSRRSCTNVMCDTYIPDVGYICDDCVKAFKETTKDIAYATEDAITDRLHDFMVTSKDSSGVPMSVDRFLNQYKN